ncbi:MAG: class B sortase [Erysipelotrichaceae bacterium]|nr:class B sortase [Erysipelotrichaceae bacterium]
MNKKKTLLLSLAVLLLLVGGFFGWQYLNRKNQQPDDIVDPAPDPEPDPVDEEKLRLKNIWNENKAINEDYVGELFFDSGLINVSFVQAKDVYNSKGELYKFYTQNGNLVTNPAGYNGNDVYIWTYWKTGEYDYNDNGGSVFMDYLNELTDENIVIYGHHFSVWNDASRTKAFTPLERLLDEAEYEDNKYVTMVLGDEIRRYELACVFEFNAYDYDAGLCPDLEYWRTEYNYDFYTGVRDADYHRRYLEAIRAKQLYYTGVDLSVNDKVLTLQTCISGHTGELFEILVFKQISVEPF